MFMFVALFCAYGMILVITQYLQNVRDYSPLAAGAVILGFSLPGPFSSYSEGRLVERIGPRVPCLIGITGVIVGMTVLAIVVGGSIPALIVGLFFLGAGVGMCIPAATAIAMGSVPDERAGMASGMLSAQRGLGSTVGFAVMGSIVAVWLGSHLGPALETVVPDAQERDAVVQTISDSANPHANVALPPKDPLPASTSATREEIADAADATFADGVRIALAVGAGAAALTALVGLRLLPRGEPSSARAALEEGEPVPTGERPTPSR
jgi:MFS family permease